MRDFTTSTFSCGSNATCGAATITSVDVGTTNFLLYARHGIFEAYVGEPLMLVQTMTYGIYPVVTAEVGVLASKDSGAVFDDLNLWEMSL